MRAFADIVRGATLAALILTSRTAAGQEANKEEGALAAAMRGKHIALTTALASLKTHGKPISAKYEYEDAKLKLSVYTSKNSQFFEVLLNDRTGKVVQTERITEGEDLVAAKAQSAALSTVYAPLSAAVRKAVHDNPGYIAVSALPSPANGR